jgi:ketosteroid isomerase-like protein
MTSDSPEHAVKMVDEAFHRGHLEGVLSFYEASAVVVREPGSFVRGHEELRNFFTGVIRAGTSARQLKTSIIEADGVALFLSRWTLNSLDGGAASKREFMATTVLRRQPNGTWKALIDNPIGPLVLGA